MRDFGADVLDKQLADWDIAAAEEVHGDGPAKAVSQHERILDADFFDELGCIGGEVVQEIGGGTGTVAVASMIGSENVAVWEESLDEPGVIHGHGGGAVQDEHVRARIPPFEIMKADGIEVDVTFAVAAGMTGHRASRLVWIVSHLRAVAD